MAPRKKTVTLTWGEETFSPKPYCSIRVGPFAVTLDVDADAMGEPQMEAAYEKLRAFAEREKRMKLKLFLQTLEEASGGR
jgi:hypothetical protein